MHDFPGPIHDDIVALENVLGVSGRGPRAGARRGTVERHLDIKLPTGDAVGGVGGGQSSCPWG
jgi:hypothetical protein